MFEPIANSDSGTRGGFFIDDESNRREVSREPVQRVRRLRRRALAAGEPRTEKALFK